MNAKLILILAFCFAIGSAKAQQKITAEKVGDKIEFRVNGNLFTNYILSEYEKYPFFFPVNGPSNASVTSMRNANYPHHSSLFFGCDRVNGGNYWQEGLERGQIISLRADIVQSGGEKAVVENECIWRRPGADAPIIDRRRISVSQPSPDKFFLDFEVSMEMLMDVTIQKTNHSFFSGRMDPDLAVTGGGKMVNAEGDSGEKGDNGTFGKRSAWMDCNGERMGKREGMAILQHPSNDWYPSPWFTRDYGFFSPTPMYWPENDQTTELKKGDQIKLRYRVIVHSGDEKEAGIAEEFEKYSKE
ncbi:PmoA family protein [Maribellus sp. CM-23]|uniref:DUF6807 domain-containing protein n=1 Tax=Maribellus sp. CM-23 TaxID=2781026 RepID=UPI001F2D57F3|nr:PmoA family protein [Maribellus sp. CM-23]MCE4563428.1 PmoA family protein [Maribellus sp. CM-23]